LPPTAAVEITRRIFPIRAKRIKNVERVIAAVG
jgi:hypothetical protein